MCGLTGYLFNKEFIVDHNEQLKKMTDSIVHRGPDSEGLWVDEKYNIAIGHRRLSILDLSSAGHQPMHSDSNRYVLAFNGEIYNHLDLRAKLEKNNSILLDWKGHSDTETLLKCFELWGVEKTLKNLSGMFSIALFDKKEKSLYLIRDRMGEKPLYYGWINNCFVFGSELKALKKFNGFKSHIDRNALALYLKYDYIPVPFSIYKGIRKLRQGSYLKLMMNNNEWNKDSALINKSYWSIQDVAKSNSNINIFRGSSKEAIKKLESLLSKSIKEQMISDVPLGAFLSGGIDSSLIASLMQKQSNRKVKTFSIGFNEQAFNEAEYAKRVATHLGTNHTELYISPSEAIKVIEKLPMIYDEPFADSSQIPTYLVSEMAKKHVTVSLSGDGGDELFGGYTRYFMANKIWRIIKLIPLFFRKFIANLIKFISAKYWKVFIAFIYIFVPKNFQVSHPVDKIYKLARILNSKNIYEVYDKLVSHWENSFDVVLNSNQKAVKKDETNYNLLPEEEMMLRDLQSYLPDDILVKVDRASMAVSLETRAPFLNKEVVEFAWQLPFNLKINKSQGKWILRQVLYKHVPKEFVDRPKMGFGIPIDSWLRGPLRNWADGLLSEKRLREDGFFNVALIRKKWHEHLSGQKNWQYDLWSVLMFQAWLDQN